MKPNSIHWLAVCCVLCLAQLMAGCMAEEHLYGRDGTEEPPNETEEPKEDYNVKLQFHLQVSVDAGTKDQLIDEMEAFTIFLFDGNGGFLRSENVERDYLLANEGTVTLNIDPGTYQMVCWGNAKAYSMITNLTKGTSINDAVVVHTYTKGGQVVIVPDGDPLYFAPRNGSTRSAAGGAYAFTVPEQGIVQAEIDFAVAHKKVRVNVDGFRGTDENGTTDCPSVHISALSCGYDFLMQPVAGAQLAYRNRTQQQTATRSGEACAVASFNTPLFTYDDRLTIDIINPADEKVALTLDLTDELKKQNIDPASQEVTGIDINIHFDETFDAAVTITTSGWTATPTLPGLD